MLTNFTQAQELKKAGYNQKATAAYNDSGILLRKTVSYNWNDNFKHYCAAPTLSEACDFLRSKGLHCYAKPYDIEFNMWQSMVAVKGSLYHDCISNDNNDPFFSDHDTALSAAITKALTVLKERNNEKTI